MEVTPAAGGGVSLALALVASATAGGWAAAVGLPSLGLLAAAELGVRLERLALVPRPGERWAAVAAALLDGVDLLLLGLPGRVRAADARRLAARARERGVVLVALAADERSPAPAWPEPPDLRLSVSGAEWGGLGVGHGRLRSRRLEVIASGRRAASRPRCCTLWLPGPGSVTPAPADVAAAGTGVGAATSLAG